VEGAIGVVAALYRYPVKSMRGTAIAETSVGWQGLEGDRRYAFVRTGDTSHFPWLTAREVPALLQYAPYLCDPTVPSDSPVRVRTPQGEDLALESAALQAELARRYGEAVHLMQSGRGAQDSAAVSVLTWASVRSLSAQIGRPLDARQFRPNIVIETTVPGFERDDDWLDRLLIFGDHDGGVRLRINRRDKRCMMVNLDPETATQDPAVLREIVHRRDQCTGLYATPERVGTVRVGDAVYLHRT
jgi:uncharacterized protein YcbX